MKKFAAVFLTAVLLLAAGCSTPEITVIDECSSTEQQTDKTQISFEEMAPQTIKTEVPHEFPFTESEMDLSETFEILEEDASIKGLGADKILRWGENEIYSFTSGDTPVMIVSFPMEDDVYVAFYYDGNLYRIYNSEYTWYFEGGEQSFVVWNYSSDGGLIFSFYDMTGSRVFTRVGEEYYDTEYGILDIEEINELRQTYGRAAEFTD